ncbi:MAG: FG-GAP-like repeat-containing protein, partial [Panacagrimonas sp.]
MNTSLTSRPHQGFSNLRLPEAFRPAPIVAVLRARRVSASRLAGPALLLSTLALLPAAPARAVEVPFGTTNISTTLNRASSTFSADLDGDGDLDVLSTSFDDNKVVWYENDGATVPGFTERTISTTAVEARSVYAADLDGDGDLDVLSASEGDNKIAWYENNGAAVPTFTLHTVSTTAMGATWVHAADLDGDGDLDVLSTSFDDDKVAWYENDGAPVPGFTLRTISTTANGAWSVHAADLDGDGDQDVLSASLHDNKIAWYENDGDALNPGFTLRTISTTASQARSVFAADLDGDGDQDVLSASSNDNKIAWYENDGAPVPGFTLRTISTTASAAFSVYTADLDGDGDVDVLSASFADDKIAWYENDGGTDPGFTLRTISTTADFAVSVHAGDVDGDGDLDVLSASTDDDTLALYVNQTIHRSAVFPAVRTISTAADGAYSVFSADLDGDGDEDVLSASAQDGEIAWYEHNGAALPAFTRRTISTTATFAQSVHAADLDGDGDVDVLSASRNDDKIAWYENDGTAVPNFTERTISTAADGARSVFSADLDGDGDVDVLSASASAVTDLVLWFENDGAALPSFTLRTISSNTNGSVAVRVADLDGDGDIDVLSALGDANRIAWYENDGASPPAFTLRTVGTGISVPRSVSAADLDGDGDVDVLSASNLDDRIAWYENDGAALPSFTQHTISLTADSTYSVSAADLDGDGDVDVLSASQNDDKIAWYENDGGADPLFSLRTISTTADAARSVHTADLDGDGDLDVLSASQFDDRIAWYPNRGGQFALDTMDLTPGSVFSGEADLPVLRIDAAHRGRTGDHAEQLTSFELLFEDGAGNDLTTAQANALADVLSVYRDDGDTAFEPGMGDTLVTSLSSLSLSAGVQVVSFADNDPLVTYAFGAAPTYFVAVDLASNANTQTPNTLKITHLTESSSTAKDADATVDIPLKLEFATNSSSATLSPQAVMNVACGPASTVATATAPSANLCVDSALSSEGVTGSLGAWRWTCVVPPTWPRCPPRVRGCEDTEVACSAPYQSQTLTLTAPSMLTVGQTSPVSASNTSILTPVLTTDGSGCGLSGLSGSNPVNATLTASAVAACTVKANHPGTGDTGTSRFLAAMEKTQVVSITAAAPVIPTGNLVQNPGFETGSLGPWYFFAVGNALGSAAVVSDVKFEGARSARVTITRADVTAPWNATLGQPLNLVAGATYTLKFRARADRNLPIRVNLQRNVAP